MGNLQAAVAYAPDGLHIRKIVFILIKQGHSPSQYTTAIGKYHTSSHCFCLDSRHGTPTVFSGRYVPFRPNRNPVREALPPVLGRLKNILTLK